MSSSITARAATALSGRRVLIVEDEVAISMLLEDMLMDLGAEIVGPAARLPAALDLAATASFDLAILDVNVGGQPVYPLAELLDGRGIRFVFSTGYGSQGIDEAFRGRPVLQKPFTQTELERVILSVLGG